MLCGLPAENNTLDSELDGHTHVYCTKGLMFVPFRKSVPNTVKPLYNGHIGPCKTGPYNEVASLLR